MTEKCRKCGSELGHYISCPDGIAKIPKKPIPKELQDWKQEIAKKVLDDIKKDATTAFSYKRIMEALNLAEKHFKECSSCNELASAYNDLQDVMAQKSNEITRLQSDNKKFHDAAWEQYCDCIILEQKFTKALEEWNYTNEGDNWVKFREHFAEWLKEAKS